MFAKVCVGNWAFIFVTLKYQILHSSSVSATAVGVSADLDLALDFTVTQRAEGRPWEILSVSIFSSKADYVFQPESFVSRLFDAAEKVRVRSRNRDEDM